MFGLGKQREGVLYGALFDIGSESIGIAIVVSEKKEIQPKILFSHRVDIRVSKTASGFEEHMRRMKEALFSASLILSRDGIEALKAHDAHGRVGKLLVTVSAPWSHTISRSVSYEGETDLKVTRDLIDDLIGSAETEIKKQIDETKEGMNFPSLIVERSTIDVRINDYSVHQPIGLRGSNISLVHVTGLIPEDILHAVTEVEEKVFPHTALQSHTFMLVLYCVLRDVLKEATALTVIHVTGESTELGIIENETLVETIAFPCGLNTIVRGLMDNDRMTGSEITSLLVLHSKGELNA